MKFLTKSYFLYIIILSVSLVSCQNNSESKMDWKIIDFNKIQGEKPFNTYFDALSRYNFNQILNHNKDVFFLLGDDSEENHDNYNAIVYSTKNFGNSWKKNAFGKGTVKEGFSLDNEVFIIVDTNRFPTSSERSSILYKSNDFGDSWTEIFKEDEGNISNINFYSQKAGIAVFSVKKGNDFVYEYRYTNDGGENWIYFDLNPDFNAVMTSDETVLFIENNINVYELNLKDGKKTLLENLAVPQNMELAYIRKDEKNSKLIAYYFGSEQNSTKSGICYLDKGQYISLPDGYYINTYDDFFYTLIDDKPYSSYAWSDDRGKTWKTKKIEEFFIVPTPTGYADKGYVYKLAALFKGSQEEKGARLVIGHPVIK